MPHIKVEPFDSSLLDRLVAVDEQCTFHAVSTKNSDELVGLVFEEEAFLLQVKKKNDAYLIKSDGITRPLDINKVKRALAYLANALSLNILHSNIAFSPTKPPLAEQSNKRIEDFEAPQFTKDKVAIEVGFGSGRHLMHQAKENPETLFIGIEIHTPSAQQVLKQIALQGIENIWIVNYDARLLLEMMPSNSCSDIYVHFPVPWDKKPHRRVISPSFLEESLRVLAPKGRLELRTDSDNYYRYALEVFSAPKQLSYCVDKNRDIAITSKYEDRWRAQEKDIYTLVVTAEQMSEVKDMAYDFGFDAAKLKPLDQIEFPAETEVEEGYFVHYEERFEMVDSKDMLVKVSFGSFDRPEHIYLMFYKGTLCYYPHDPVRTQTNYRAHQKIGERVYG